MVARFLASMMMHINVEKDVRNGIAMMKYVCNHHDHFTNVYPSFVIGFLLMIISLIVEINVMIILSSMPIFYQTKQNDKKYKNEDKFYIFFNLFHLNQAINLQLNVNKIAAAFLASRGSLFQVV